MNEAQTKHDFIGPDFPSVDSETKMICVEYSITQARLAWCCCHAG